MKKALKLTLTLLVICIMMIGSVNAVSSNINMKASKTTIEEGEEFTVEVYTSNLQSDTGVITFSATLNYDKEKLELVKFEGENDWETPKEGRSYNSSTGKIAIEREEPGTSGEVIFKITFKAKEKIEADEIITLEDVMLADGMTTPVKKDIVKLDKSITPEETDNSSDTTTPDNTDNTTTDDSSNEQTTNTDNTTTTTDNNNTNTSSSTSKTDTTTKTGTLPQTGDNNITVAVLIALLILAVAIFYIRMMNINRKLKN